MAAAESIWIWLFNVGIFSRNELKVETQVVEQVPNSWCMVCGILNFSRILKVSKQHSCLHNFSSSKSVSHLCSLTLIQSMMSHNPSPIAREGAKWAARPIHAWQTYVSRCWMQMVANGVNWVTHCHHYLRKWDVGVVASSTKHIPSPSNSWSFSL